MTSQNQNEVKVDSVAQDNINSMYQLPTQYPAGVFRTYDIRGEVGEASLNADVAYAIGLAIGSEARDRGLHKIIVGRDGRLTGDEFKAALVTGLLETGCDVIDIGRVPTPLVYFATHHLDANSGVMVTASHNPGNHNGFKIVMDGQTLAADGIQQLLKRLQNNEFVRGEGKLEQADIIPTYFNYIKEHVHLARPLKIVIDCGNGIAGEIAPTLFRELGCEVSELFCEVDGRFPNHHPDPTIPENLKAIIERVQQEKADIGLAFDGDADRLGVVTNSGAIVWPDRQMMLFAKDLLSRQSGADIVFDVKCSSVLPQVIRENGGNPIMYRTGHSILKAKMVEIGAPLAGEMSGHIFFKEGWFGFDDGLYVGSRLLKILSEFSGSADELFAQFPQTVNTPELKLPMSESDKPDFMRRLLSDADFGDGERVTIDGLRVEFDYGWLLVRPSNTSPYLIIRFEADTQEHLQALQEKLRGELLKLKPDLSFPF